MQEHRCPGCLESKQARIFQDKDIKFNFYSAQDSAQGGVGILLAECWADKVVEVQHISDRILPLKLIIGKGVFTFLSIYAPQANYPDAINEYFYDELQHTVAKVPATEILIPVGDWNSHIGAAAGVYSDTHGSHGFGKCNTESERVLEFAIANGLHVGNIWFILPLETPVTIQPRFTKYSILRVSSAS